MDAVDIRDVARVTVRDHRREALEAAVRLNPGGKLARKAQSVLLDMGRWDDFRVECGGDDAALFFLCAQVASGVSLKTVCKEYVIDYGLMWAWLSEDSERLHRYELALKGLADAYVSEAVGVADDEEDVSRGKLMVDTRLRVAAKWDKKRYGDEKSGLTLNMGANSLLAVLSGMPSAAETDRREKAILEGEKVAEGEVEMVDAGGCAPPVVVEKVNEHGKVEGPL